MLLSHVLSPECWAFIKKLLVVKIVTKDFLVLINILLTKTNTALRLRRALKQNSYTSESFK